MLEYAIAEARRLGLEELESSSSTPLSMGLALQEFRIHLLKVEAPKDIRSLEAATFWELTDKYRFDALSADIPLVGRFLAHAIGAASYARDHCDLSPRGTRGNLPFAEFLFSIDYGIRLVASGWDRLALLIDLGFSLNTNYRCSLPLVLQKLPAARKGIESNPTFIQLKQFRDTDYADLGAKRGEGARNEATHLITPACRIFFEMLENTTGPMPVDKLEEKMGHYLQLLVKHHGLYCKGIRDSAKLIGDNWKQDAS